MIAQAEGSALKEVLPWVTTFVVAVIGAVLTPALKRRWKEEALREARVTIHPPVPTIHTKEEVELVTKDELNEHLARIEKAFDEIKDALDSERSIARTANGNLHKRIDAMSERLGDRLANLEGTAKATADTVKTLLDIALGKKPTAR